MQIDPSPTDEEAVAIAAAINVILVEQQQLRYQPPVASPWRFSGRWWHRGQHQKLG